MARGTDNQRTEAKGDVSRHCFLEMGPASSENEEKCLVPAGKLHKAHDSMALKTEEWGQRETHGGISKIGKWEMVSLLLFAPSPWERLLFPGPTEGQA